MHEREIERKVLGGAHKSGLFCTRVAAILARLFREGCEIAARLCTEEARFEQILG